MTGSDILAHLVCSNFPPPKKYLSPVCREFLSVNQSGSPCWKSCRHGSRIIKYEIHQNDTAVLNRDFWPCRTKREPGISNTSTTLSTNGLGYGHPGIAYGIYMGIPMSEIFVTCLSTIVHDANRYVSVWRFVLQKGTLCFKTPEV